MSPTALGARRSDMPLPVHSIQRNFGNNTGTQNWPAAGVTFGAGWNMQIGVRPERRCVWVVEAQMILYRTAGAWSRADWGLYCTPADLNGKTFQQAANTDEHGGNWHTDAMSCVWFLEANTSYVCDMRSIITDAAHFYYMSYIHTTIVGYTIGDGVY